MNNNTRKLVEKTQLKDTLQQEFDFSLEQRIERYLELKPHRIIPNSHFASVSAECHLLYRDAHYYGTISLTQAVAEALVKFLCTVNSWKPDKVFEKNLKQLEKRGKIAGELKTEFSKIWKRRDDYHHLNLQIEQDRQKLEILAKEKLACLKQIEEELFAFSTNNGKLVPKFPKYWDQKDGKVPVYLRLD
ncbi:hypothetical protein KKF92_00085 [Patescibacteria group bacterium]|nr:hypothetical protein [Patescibacteria group bacterium]